MKIEFLPRVSEKKQFIIDKKMISLQNGTNSQRLKDVEPLTHWLLLVLF